MSEAKTTRTETVLDFGWMSNNPYLALSAIEDFVEKHGNTNVQIEFSSHTMTLIWEAE